MLGMQKLLAVAVAAASLARAHTVITYPGWRGNNLHTNGTLPEANPDTIGVDFYDDGTKGFPWGMQWIYPCTSFEHSAEPAAKLEALTDKSDQAAASL